MTTDLTRSTAADLADLLAKGSVSAREVAQATSTAPPPSTATCTPTSTWTPRARWPRRMPSTGAVPRASRSRARRCADRGQGRHDDARLPTTCGSRILQGWVPPYDATLVTRLREAGLPILGKTNMDEFAMGSSTEHSAYGPSRNPWDLDRIPADPAAGRPRSSRRSRPRSRSAPTRAARSASRRPSRAPSAPSRPTAASPATGSWRWRRRSTRPGRARAHRARRRPPPRGDRRPRPDGLHLDRRPCPAGPRGRPPRRRLGMRIGSSAS